MEQFDLYVHGVPVGHEICGCNEERDYIKRFYNDDVVEESSLLQIDVVNGKSFYTYLRKKNVRNVDGRTGSYFGLTVSFANRYCTNVQVLYELLDAIHKQICVGCLVKSESGADRFLVKNIAASQYKDRPVVDYIKAVFGNNIKSLRFDALKGFVNSYSEAKFNLKEVDSPLFHETLKNKRILVSPEYRMASGEIEPIRYENEQLKLANAQLKESNNHLSNEVERLKSELSECIQSLKDLQTQLDECKREKEELESNIKDAINAMCLIDEPFKKLTRLLAGRFQKEVEKDDKKPSEISSANKKKHTKALWLPVNSIILLFIFTCLCYVVILFQSCLNLLL